MTGSLKHKLILVLLSTFTFNQAIAESDIKNRKHGVSVKQIHKGHQKNNSESQQYHGVYYGLLPCKDCDGIKTTLSLKNRSNYLIVTQPAKASAREYFEKGKYTWDTEKKIITLKPRKKSNIRKYRINDEKTITQLSSDGTPLKNKQKNTSYVLHKRDMVKKNTAMHNRH